MADLLDSTARQVRQDRPRSPIHRLVGAEQHRDGRVYWTRCGDVLSNTAGAILTTHKADCHECRNGWVRHG